MTTERPPIPWPACPDEDTGHLDLAHRFGAELWAAGAGPDTIRRIGAALARDEATEWSAVPLALGWHQAYTIDRAYYRRVASSGDET